MHDERVLARYWYRIEQKNGLDMLKDYLHGQAASFILLRLHLFGEGHYSRSTFTSATVAIEPSALL